MINKVAEKPGYKYTLYHHHNHHHPHRHPPEVVVPMQVLGVCGELQVLVLEAQPTKAENHGLHDAVSPRTHQLMTPLWDNHEHKALAHTHTHLSLTLK